MNTTSPSTELAHISTELLLQQVIRQNGTDRSTDQRTLIDADWTTDQAAGEARVRLIQIGFGAKALYALRVKNPDTDWTDCYHYSQNSEEVTQSAIGPHTPHTKPLALPNETAADVLHPILYSSFAGQ